MFKHSYLPATNHRYLAHGSYGVVYVNRETSRIIKVAYRSRGKSAEHCAQVFGSEYSALEIAQADKHLRQLVAAPFNRTSISEVLDEHGKCISEHFYLDLAFEAEFIDGDFTKIGNAFNASNNLEIQQMFRKAGIKHTLDAQVKVIDNKIVKVVDFATKEVELLH